MSRAQPPPEPSGEDGSDRPPSWMGAPGYSPYRDDLPPHAPMPGAPPYPSAPEHAPSPVGRPAPGTRFLRALGAAAIWAAVNVVLVLIVAGAPPSGPAVARLLGVLAVAAVLAALAVWLIARHRGWAFWMLVLTAAPFFWMLRSLTTLVGG